MLVYACVSYDLHLIDRGRLALKHTHLEINRVTLHIHLHRIHIEEQVSAVRIEFAYRIIIPRQSVIQGLEVIYIARFHTQYRIQIIIGIHRITYPFDRTDIVFVSFADCHIDIHACRILRIRHYAVGDDIRVTVTVLVIFLNHRLFVFLIFLGDELLGAEEVDDIVIVRLLHRLVDLAVRQGLITGDIDLSDLGLRFLVNSDQHPYIPRMIRIVLLNHMHLCIMKSLLRQVFLDHRLRMVLQIRCHLASLTNTGFHLHILSLAFLQSLIAHLADTRALLQRNDQPYLVTLDLLCLNLHRREQALLPETFDRLGDLVSRHLNLISHRQAGEADQHEILIAVRPFHFNPCNLVGLTRHPVLNLLRLQREKDKG